MISLLGSTGNIGCQTLEVMEFLGIKPAALAAGGNQRLLEEQARKYKPRLIAIYDEKAARELKAALKDMDIRIVSGESGIIEAATIPEASTVVSAISGFSGLRPAIAAIREKKRLALANKETLVAAGELVMAEARRSGAEIIPVDSEHSAIFQCLKSGGEVHRLLLTASGGPFRGKKTEDLRQMTAKEALNHPNWKMGPKITVDSATLMNKGLEIIEAMHLFGMPAEQITVLVHPQSIIHSMVEFTDGSVIAQLGWPDMRLPIQYALTYPERLCSPVKKLDFTAIKHLDFEEPDTETFGCLALAVEAAKNGGTDGAVLNAANEAAVYEFLNGRIGFLDIYRLVSHALYKLGGGRAESLEDVIAADGEARRLVKECI